MPRFITRQHVARDLDVAFLSVMLLHCVSWWMHTHSNFSPRGRAINCAQSALKNLTVRPSTGALTPWSGEKTCVFRTKSLFTSELVGLQDRPEVTMDHSECKCPIDPCHFRSSVYLEWPWKAGHTGPPILVPFDSSLPSFLGIVPPPTPFNLECRNLAQ